MKPRPLLFLTLLPQLALAGVDLSPRYSDSYTDGIVFHRLYFADGEKKITLSLDRETKVTAESGGTCFRFPKLPEATFLVLRSRQSPSETFEGLALDRYRESARRLLPLRARAVTIREETANPLRINRWRSYRLLLSCEVGPDRYQQSVTFLNLNDDDQIVLITTAPERQFAEAAERSFQIIRTWQPMLPGDEPPPRGN